MLSRDQIDKAKHKALRRCKNEILHRRRLSRPMEWAFRFEIPGGSDWRRRFIRVKSHKDLDEILRFDRDVEVHFQPVLDQWVVYRRLQLGLTDADDVLRYQYTINCSIGSFDVRDLRRRSYLAQENLSADEFAKKSIEQWDENVKANDKALQKERADEANHVLDALLDAKKGKMTATV